MKINNLKTVIMMFSMLLCFGTFAQRPQGGQGGRNGGGQNRGQENREKPDAAKILAMLDTNKDEVIDKDEASQDKRGKISEDFDRIDTDVDGLITLEELKVSLKEGKPKEVSPEKLIKQIDDNGDGTLNELEIAAKNNKELSTNFSDIDTNQDNELDVAELKAFYDKKEKPKRKKRD